MACVGFVAPRGRVVPFDRPGAGAAIATSEKTVSIARPPSRSDGGALALKRDP
jgi:hypothetical protein